MRRADHGIGAQAGLSGRAVAVILTLCTAAAVVEGIDIQSTGIVAPQYAHEFGLSKPQLGLIFGLNNFGLLIGSIIAGWATDRIGRRWTAIASMMCFGAFSVGCALAPTGLVFTVMRVLIGVGIGGSLANIIAITAEAGTVTHRAARVTVMTAAVAIGGAIPGFVLGKWPELDWRIIYQIGGWSPLAVGAAMLLWLPESLPFLKARMEQRAAAAPNAFAALFTQGRTAITLVLWIATFGAFLIYYVINNWLPSLMVARAFSTREASIAAALFTSGGAVGTVLLGLLLAKARNLAVTLTFLGCLAAVCALARIGDAGWLLAIVFALGAFATTAKNMLYGFAPLYYPVTIRGAGVGAAVSWGRIGSILGPYAAGVLLGAGGGTAAVLLSLIPVLILAMIATLALSWLRKPEAE